MSVREKKLVCDFYYWHPLITEALTLNELIPIDFNDHVDNIPRIKLIQLNECVKYGMRVSEEVVVQLCIGHKSLWGSEHVNPIHTAFPKMIFCQQHLVLDIALFDLALISRVS